MVWSTQSFENNLRQMESELDSIWEEGRYHPCLLGSGKHFTLRGKNRPVSVSMAEGRFLYNLTCLRKARTGFEIGTAFGYSALMIAGGIASIAGEAGWFCSLDAQLEGELGAVGIDFAKKWSKKMGLDEVANFDIGLSPVDVASSVGSRWLDIVFIDGNHREEQPLLDFQAVLPFLNDESIVIWHDVHPDYSVPVAVSSAKDDGFSFQLFDTSCRMGVSYKNPRVSKLAEIAMDMALHGKFISSK